MAALPGSRTILRAKVFEQSVMDLPALHGQHRLRILVSGGGRGRWPPLQSRWFTILITLPSGARTKNRRKPHASVVIGCTIS